MYLYSIPGWGVDDHCAAGGHLIVQCGDLAGVLSGHLHAGLSDVEGPVSLVRVGGHLVVKVCGEDVIERGDEGGWEVSPILDRIEPRPWG